MDCRDFDGQVVRSSPELNEAARDYVCVRVTNMWDVDLSKYRFDFDLTLAALLMHPDGTIYRTYAGRDFEDADSHHSVDSLVLALREAKADHQAHQQRGSAPKLEKPWTIGESPAMQFAIERQGKADCVHCHTIYDMRYRDLQATNQWTADHRWLWPDPIEMGIRLDRERQSEIVEVRADSPAAAAGLEAGDVLDHIGGRRVRSFGDLQRVLEELPNVDCPDVEVQFTRPEVEGALRASMSLPDGWKEATPEVYAWRSSKWPLTPKPGFGGEPLDPDELRDLGLPIDSFAFRVGYLVTWGDAAYTGHNAQKAGIRKNDVVHSIDGKSDFESMSHFHAWFRLTRVVGEKARVELIRGGKKKVVELAVIDAAD